MVGREEKDRRFSRSLFVGAVFVLSLSVFLFMVLFPFRDDSLTRVEEKGIRIGYAVEAPYAFLTPAGEPTGEAPEEARVVARKLEIDPILWRQVEFDSLIDELEAGRIDVIAAGLFITPERKERIRFSLPTFQVKPGLLVPKGNPLNLQSYADLVQADEGVVIVLAGSVEARTLLELGLPEERLKAVPDVTTGLAALEAGLADALALSSPSLQWLAVKGRLRETESVALSGLTASEEPQYGAFAFRKEDRRLRQAWNAVLKSYIGSPEHLALVAPFGFSAEEIPGGTSSPSQESRP